MTSHITVDAARCKGCNLCLEVCPKNVIEPAKISNNAGYTYVRAGNPDACIGCGMCAQVCPDCAITVEKDGKVIASKPAVIREESSTYCPGCAHGVVQRLIAEAIDEMGGKSEFIGVTPIGCSIFIYKIMDLDFVEGAHGRAPAVASGIKRVHPGKHVFTYQGDGDISSIGISEILHAAIRNEKIAVFFLNNGNYGMTGGQAAPTTLVGQVTSSTPYGKTVEQGMPIHMCELLANVAADNAYIARGASDTPQHIRKTGQYVKKALENSMSGFSIVEVLGICPSNWKMTPVKSLDWVRDKMIPNFKLGEIKPRGMEQ